MLDNQGKQVNKDAIKITVDDETTLLEDIAQNYEVLNHVVSTGIVKHSVKPMTAMNRNVRTVFTPKARYQDVEKASLGPMSTGPITPTLSNGTRNNGLVRSLIYRKPSPTRKSLCNRSRENVFSKMNSKPTMNYTTVFERMRSPQSSYQGIYDKTSKSIKSSDVGVQYLSSSMPVSKDRPTVNHVRMRSGSRQIRGGNFDIMGQLGRLRKIKQELIEQGHQTSGIDINMLSQLNFER